MNKKCLCLTSEQYDECISLLQNGFMLEGKLVRPNIRIATIAVVQTSLGLRICDILKLRMTSFIKDGNRYRLDIVEQKTGKVRNFTVPIEVYSYIQEYAIQRGISKDAKLFSISERQVERHLNKVFEKMGLPLRNYGTHSFRKTFAMQVYTESGYNIELVRELLQHSNTAITQRYLNIGTKMIEDALASTVKNLR